MKRKLALILAIVLVLTFGVTLASCDKDEYVIKVGNTAATTGAFASVGVPFNYGLEAYLWYYSTQTNGYYDADNNKYSFEFIHYDDGFDGAVGATYTEKLVEDDKVFAIVGHFGTNTVAATVDYLEEQGIPMVYAATGVSNLFGTESNIMAVQPIYDTEGMSMLATAVAPTTNGLGLGGTKIGVISTTDEAGRSIKAGIVREQATLGLVTNTNIFYQDVDATATEFNAAVNALKTAGCDVIIIAANQAPFINIAKSIKTNNYDNVKIITSYVSANNNTMGTLAKEGVITATRQVFAGSWLVTGAVPTLTKGWSDFVEFVRIMTAYARHIGEDLVPPSDPAFGALIKMYFGGYEWAMDGVSLNWLNSYAMAGYVAGNVFCQGLTRIRGQELTWEAYVDAMEEAPVNIPMGLTVNYADGQRIGIDALALNQYVASGTGDAAIATGVVYRPLTLLSDIEDAIED